MLKIEVSSLLRSIRHNHITRRWFRLDLGQSKNRDIVIFRKKYPGAATIFAKLNY
jgi:hypothetical protein